MDKIIALLNEATGNKLRETETPNVFVIDSDDIAAAFTEENADTSKVTFVNSNVAHGIIGPIHFVGLAVRADLPSDFFDASEDKETDLSVLSAITMRLTDPEGEDFEPEVYICATDGNGGMSQECCDIIKKRAGELKEKRSELLLQGLMMTKMQGMLPHMTFYSSNDQTEGAIGIEF